MPKIACTRQGRQTNANNSLPSALELLRALTEEQHQRLRAFARKRLDRAALRPNLQRLLAGATPEDLVDAALEKLLLGDTYPKKGRKLPSKNRQSTDAFLRCVMGIINSDLSNLATSAEASFLHLSFSEEEDGVGGVQVAEPLSIASLLQRRDFERQLFARLEPIMQNEPSLAPVIHHWSEHFQFADRIAGPEFDPNLVYRVRQHAQRISRELAQEIQPGQVTGLEMLT
jgi:hypothetical protein